MAGRAPWLDVLAAVVHGLMCRPTVEITPAEFQERIGGMRRVFTKLNVEVPRTSPLRFPSGHTLDPEQLRTDQKSAVLAYLRGLVPPEAVRLPHVLDDPSAGTGHHQYVAVSGHLRVLLDDAMRPVEDVEPVPFVCAAGVRVDDTHDRGNFLHPSRARLNACLCNYWRLILSLFEAANVRFPVLPVADEALADEYVQALRHVVDSGVYGVTAVVVIVSVPMRCPAHPKVVVVETGAVIHLLLELRRHLPGVGLLCNTGPAGVRCGHLAGEWRWDTEVTPERRLAVQTTLLLHHRDFNGPLWEGQPPLSVAHEKDNKPLP